MERRDICQAKTRAWTQRRRQRMVIASTTADTMTTDPPIVVETPMAIADDVSAAAQGDKRSDGGVAVDVDEQHLKRSREIWEHVKEEQYEGTDPLLPLPLLPPSSMRMLTCVQSSSSCH
jgi:hypothetical protein